MGPGVFEIPVQVLGGEFEMDFYAQALHDAQIRVVTQAQNHKWEALLEKPLVSRCRFYGSYPDFIQAAPELKPPAQELGIGMSVQQLHGVDPASFLKAHPHFQDLHMFEKLLAFQLNQVLHRRVMKDNDLHLGPLWFRWGLASYLADQFPFQQGQISQAKVWRVLMGYQGHVQIYNQIMRYFLHKAPLKTLLKKAKQPTFLDELRALESL